MKYMITFYYNSLEYINNVHPVLMSVEVGVPQLFHLKKPRTSLSMHLPIPVTRTRESQGLTIFVLLTRGSLLNVFYCVIKVRGGVIENWCLLQIFHFNLQIYHN
jgi:hypothetical protein